MNSRATQLASIVAVVVLAAIVIVLIVASSSGASKTPPAATQVASPASTASSATPGSTGIASTATPALGQRTKTEGCIINGALQDLACTPGAVFPNVTKAQICTPGYAKSVRNVPQAEKDQVYAEYGIAHHKAGDYEVDHLVSLELGGSNEIANLWPEAASPTPGFHQKDRYENYLHDQVCSGAISLQEAQRRIAQNWLQYWQEAGQP